MAQKNDTPALIVALLVTAGLIGGGVWWLSQRPGGIGGLISSEGGPENDGDNVIVDPPPAPPPSTGDTFSSVANVPNGLFNYGGSTSFAPIRGSIDPQMTSAFPGFELRYTEPLSGAPGSVRGIQMLLDNELAFAQSSRSPNDQENQSAEQRGFALNAIPVAIEGIAIAVNPNLDVSGLTVPQLRDIYTGAVTNWNQVGGPNLPITPFSRPSAGGTVEFFIANVLGGASFGSTVRSIPTTTEALRAVSSSPGGIYFASAPEVVGQCTVKPLAIGRQASQLVAPYQGEIFLSPQCPTQRTQLNIDALRSNNYPLTRRLFVIVKQNGQPDQQAGEAYANLLLTRQGQDLLQKAGFVPIR